MNEEQIPPDGEEPEEESFAELFEAYSNGMSEDLSVGDRITGKIIAIEKESLFLDTGSKVDGVVERAELLDDNGELPYAVGDELELYVVSANESEIRLSRAVSGAGGLEMLSDAYASKIPVEGTVTQSIKGGFAVEMMKRRTFCPISQIDTKYVENPDEYLGQTFSFLIKRFEEKGRNIVVSRRDLLEQEQAAARKEFFKTISVGDDLEGTVTKLMPFGAFVELTPGVEGLVHISELGWSRVEHPEQAVKSGERVRVKLLKMEPGEGGKPAKLSLSIKQTSGNPWDTVTETVQNGAKMNGRVTRIMPFGAFVEIVPGIEGLVHISEMSYTKRVHTPDEVVQPGQTVFVVVKSVDPESRRVSLSLRDAEGDPWADVENKYRKGQSVSGTVEKQERFGSFINLEPGITGLLPRSRITAAQDGAAVDRLKPGDQITVVIDTVNLVERKISLSLGGESDSEEWKHYRNDDSQAAGGGGMGSLGDMLKQAMDAKNKK
jgi:small subunit ribosomal protein S1